MISARLSGEFEEIHPVRRVRQGNECLGYRRGTFTETNTLTDSSRADLNGADTCRGWSSCGGRVSYFFIFSMAGILTLGSVMGATGSGKSTVCCFTQRYHSRTLTFIEAH